MFAAWAVGLKRHPVDHNLIALAAIGRGSHRLLGDALRQMQPRWQGKILAEIACPPQMDVDMKLFPDPRCGDRHRDRGGRRLADRLLG